MVSLDNAKLVLTAFFGAPHRARYIREVSKTCALSYERVHHSLKGLEKINAVASKTRGKIKEYSINRKSELALKIFSFLEMERRQEFFSRNPRLAVWLQNVGDELETESKTKTDIRFVILFGSYARGEEKKDSDIDVLIVAKNMDRAFESQLDSTAKKMASLSGKKFSLHPVELEDLRLKWKKEPFYATLWLDRILLSGDEDFWKEILELGEPA